MIFSFGFLAALCAPRIATKLAFETVGARVFAFPLGRGRVYFSGKIFDALKAVVFFSHFHCT